jgi:hypothetical protein
MRADELMRRLISGELANYSVVRTSPEPLQQQYKITSLITQRCSTEIGASLLRSFQTPQTLFTNCAETGVANLRLLLAVI